MKKLRIIFQAIAVLAYFYSWKYVWIPSLIVSVIYIYMSFQYSFMEKWDELLGIEDHLYFFQSGLWLGVSIFSYLRF